jgi:phosphate transport system substrate-binding protein
MSRALAVVLSGAWIVLTGGPGFAGTSAAPGLEPPAVDTGLPHYVPTAQVSGSLHGVTGMDSVEAMFKAWSAAFAKYHPGTSVTVTQRDVAPEERIAIGPDTDEVFHPDDSVYDARFGYGPFRIKICQGAFVMKSHVSAIGVFVSKANPLTQVSLDRLDAIYSQARRRGYPADITTWGQLGLGGEWADRPVHFYGFYGRDDVTWYFRDLVSYDAPFRTGYRVPGSGDMGRRTPVVAQDLMATLEADPGAIGFANFSYQSGGVKALALVDERGVVSQPSMSEVVSGRYPLQRGLYIYVNRKPGAPLGPQLREFFEFVLSREGQSLVHIDHYLPLTASMAAAERAKLD